MITEEKQLLLKDLSARLPYKVKISVTEPERTEFTNQFSYENGRTLVGVIDAIFPDEERIIVDELDKPIAQYDVRCGGFNIEEYKIKPYLRPMSSMTEEEEREVGKLGVCYDGAFHNDIYDVGICMEEAFTAISWLLERHFDINYLIQKGLALEAPEGMYKIN